jgi:hypothetical protein
MSMHELLDADQRLVLLRALTEMPASAANESVLKTALQHLGHRVGSDIVRAHLEYLARHGLVAVEQIRVERGDLWIATLTAAGEDVAEGRATHVGVKRRGAD